MTQPDFWSRNSGKVIHTNFMGTFVLDEFSPKFAIRLVPEIGFFFVFEPRKVGHQEAILDAILLLDDTVREIRFGSLKSTAKKLFEKCLKLQNLRNPMQNDRPIGGHGFPLDTINSSQLSNKVCLIKIQMDQLRWIIHSRLIHF